MNNKKKRYMKRSLLNICTTAIALLFSSTISKAESIELRSQIENATVKFYSLSGDTKGEEINSVNMSTEYVLADIQPASGYWTHINLLKEPEGLVDISDASVRTRRDEYPLGIKGSIEAFGETAPNGGGMYKLGINTIEGIKCIVLEGVTVEKINLSSDEAININGIDYHLSINDRNPGFTYNGEHQAISIDEISLQSLYNDPLVFDVNDNLEITLKKDETDIEESISAGSYQLVISGKADGCFKDSKSFSYRIGKAALTISADDKVKTYGAENPEWTFSYNGFVNNENENVLLSKPTASVTGTNVGNYDIVPKGASADNYNITYANGKLAIKKTILTATAKDATVQQGYENPTFEITYSGFVNGEDETAITTLPTATTTRQTTSEPGEYPINVSGGDATNYEFVYVEGTLTVTAADPDPVPVTITAKDITIEYGKEIPEFEYTATEGITVTGTPSFSCEANSSSPVGTYPIVITAGSLTNDNVTFVNGTLTITKAPLTITADNKSKTYGEDNPTLTCTYSGFVNDETDEVMSTKPTLTTTAIATSNVGAYDITAADAVAANYEISYAKGTLTVNPKNLALSVSLGTTSFTYDGDEKEPSVTVTTTDDTVITTSDYELSGTLSATVAGDYSITATPKGNYTGSAVSADWSIESSTSTDAEGNSITEDGVDVTLESASENNIDENGKLTLPDEITKIDDNAFSGIDKTKIESVDLTNTNLTGVNVDRESGAFSDFPENVMIYLPSGNTAAANEPNVVIAGECQELKLTEDGEVEIPTGFTAAKITYVRSLTVERASTICLPYTLSSDATISYYELSSSTANALVFTEVTTTDVNKPYLAIPKTAGASLGKTVSTSVSSNTNIDDAEQSVTGYNMIGTEKRISRADAMGKYILQDDNMWHQVTSESPASVYIPAYRAYIENTTSAPARLQIVVEGSDGTTAISRIKTIDADGSEHWYDLNGRRLQAEPNAKGTYIVNGKKVVK